MIEHTIQTSGSSTAIPKGLIPFRRFAAAMSEFSDFDAFRSALERIVSEDTDYAGFLELDTDMRSIPDEDVGEHFVMDSLVVPLSSGEDRGYIRFSGNEQGRPFDTEDLMWIGAISEFVSLAYANAKTHRQGRDKLRIFEYLINQLPLGIVCLGGQGDLIIKNKLATRLLGAAGADLLRSALAEQALKSQESLRLHIEVDGKLLYAEARRLEIEAGNAVTAFVLHDLSAQRERLLLQVERSVFRAESRGTSWTVAVLEDRSEAGRLLRALKVAADPLGLDVSSFAALDAYSCACIFTAKSPRSVRYLLQRALAHCLDPEQTAGALISQIDQEDEALAQSLIQAACADFQPLEQFLRPVMLVLDPYPAVSEALELLAGEFCCFKPVEGVAEAIFLIQSGEFDGIFLDVDAYGEDASDLERLRAVGIKAGAGFRLYYMTHMQAAMAQSKFDLSVNSTVLEKPFDSGLILEALRLQFDFS
ncbi:hypothetical protein QEH52_03035 [Coraliomargarita sp. SDUM461003]|uniref:Response regulatory domain-containing protein n=1 Tax=Thalassobacterium maritimum TaxID=3041265 RepID=A0ABU1ATB9_9BACT|nr:hypothetical protein [Coraliomargarita sp. SDUM461003]MDQ8206469.1 hypothetical protein [Coraliomargarita sp. SDUM461003]